MTKSPIESPDKPVIFPVKSGTNDKALGSAIGHELEKRHEVIVRAIGVQAVNQAVKAIAIAGGFVGSRGRQLLTRIGFETVTLTDREDPTKVNQTTAISFFCTTK